MDEAPDNTRILLARYRAGDKAALENLLARYYPRVATILRIRLGPARLARADIDDYRQEVMKRVFQSIDRYEERGDAHFIDWVAAIAQHVICNEARDARTKKRGGGQVEEVSRTTESGTDADHAADSTLIPGKVVRNEERELLYAGIARLDEPHREVIVLRQLMGFDWQNVARKMGRPSAEACQELFRRAVMALSARWNEKG